MTPLQAALLRAIAASEYNALRVDLDGYVYVSALTIDGVERASYGGIIAGAVKAGLVVVGSDRPANKRTGGRRASDFDWVSLTPAGVTALRSL